VLIRKSFLKVFFATDIPLGDNSLTFFQSSGLPHEKEDPWVKVISPMVKISLGEKKTGFMGQQQ